MGECDLSDEKVEHLKWWREVASRHYGENVLHFNFEDEKNRPSRIKESVNKFIEYVDEKSFKNMWKSSILYSVTQAAAPNNVWENNNSKELVSVIVEIKEAEKYNHQWEEKIKNAGPNTFGELFGQLHIDKHPIWNNASITGLEFFGVKSKSNRSVEIQKANNPLRSTGHG